MPLLFTLNGLTMNNTIEIKGKDFVVRSTTKASFEFEKKFNKQEPQTQEEVVYYMFFLLKNANKDRKKVDNVFSMTFDAFCDCIDDDIMILPKMTDILVESKREEEQILLDYYKEKGIEVSEEPKKK